MSITVNPAPPVNKAPTANAGPDQTVTIAAGQSNIAVKLNGGGSSDSDGTIRLLQLDRRSEPGHTASPTVTLAAGSYTFTLVVTDNNGASSAADRVNVTVNPAPPVNQSPSANAGPDQTVTLAAGQQHRRDPQRQWLIRRRRHDQRLQLDRQSEPGQHRQPHGHSRRAPTPSVWSSPTTTARAARRTR